MLKAPAHPIEFIHGSAICHLQAVYFGLEAGADGICFLQSGASRTIAGDFDAVEFGLEVGIDGIYF